MNFMKKLILFLLFISVTAEIYTFEINLDAEMNFYYNNYLKNEIYRYLSQNTTLTAFDSQQKLRLKIKQMMDEIKFDFDARLYLKPNKNELEYFIDSVYFSFENGPFILYAGKQRIKWGVGYTWNPTNKLQPAKNILDPEIDLEGFYALRMEYSSNFITPSFIIAPELISDKFIENIRFAVQLYKLIGSADVYLNYIYQDNFIQTIGSAISCDFDLVILNLEGAAIRYIRIPDEFRDVFICDDNSLDWSYLVGLTKNIKSDFFISIEYYYNGWGLTNKEFNDYCFLNNNFSYFGIKKRYLSFNFSWTWDEKLSFAITCIFSEQDFSFILYPRIEYIENSNFNFEIGFIENITDKDKETYYSMPVYNITSLKLKTYF